MGSTVRTATVRMVAGGTVGLVMVVMTARAAAQDVDVHVKISPNIAREIRDAVQTAVGPEVRDELAKTIRDVVREVSVLGETGGLLQQGRDRDFPVEQTKRETKTVSLGPSGALDLKNVSGDVHVTAGPGRDATIELMYRSRGRTDADAKLGLSSVTVTIQQRGERTSVESIYPNDRRPPYQVDITYNVVVPAGTRVTAGTTGGSVTVKGVNGERLGQFRRRRRDRERFAAHVSATTVGGNVSVTGVDSDTALRVETMGGNITLRQIKARRVNAVHDRRECHRARDHVRQRRARHHGGIGRVWRPVVAQRPVSVPRAVRHGPHDPGGFDGIRTRSQHVLGRGADGDSAADGGHGAGTRPAEVAARHLR